jgi:hypothetical protein
MIDISMDPRSLRRKVDIELSFFIVYQRMYKRLMTSLLCIDVVFAFLLIAYNGRGSKHRVIPFPSAQGRSYVVENLTDKYDVSKSFLRYYQFCVRSQTLRFSLRCDHPV